MSSTSDYTPYPYQRFKISADKYSQKRIKDLSRIRKELQDDYTIPISFVVYGSLTKGKILNKKLAREADIDFSVFYDIDDINISELVKKFEINGDLDPELLLGNHIVSDLRQRLIRCDLTENQLDNIWSYPVTTALISDRIDSIKPNIKNWSSEELHDDFISSDQDLWALVRMFYLDIGNNLTSRKLELLNDLKSRGEFGELLWEYLNMIIKDQERQDNMTYEASVEYPDSLEEAIKKYTSNDWMENE